VIYEASNGERKKKGIGTMFMIKERIPRLQLSVEAKNLGAIGHVEAR